MQRAKLQDRVLHSYVSGGCEVTILSSGTKVRTTVDQSLAPVLPEQMDLKITNECDAGCAWCHEMSTPSGAHGDLGATMSLLEPLPPGTEIAIGGGDPLSHPGFVGFVRALRQRGIVPSVTVNGRHLERHLGTLRMLTGEGSLFGVGVSFHTELPKWDYEHLVVHLITGVNPPSVLDSAERKMKVLLLGYKRFGRGRDLFELHPEPVTRRMAQWYRELFTVAHNHHLSFDALAIEQLNPRRLFRSAEAYERQYMGPEGECSMYLDAVTQTFATSSYSDQRARWTDMRSMFAAVRAGQGFAVAA